MTARRVTSDKWTSASMRRAMSSSVGAKLLLDQFARDVRSSSTRFPSHTCNGLHGKRDNELSVPLFPNMLSSKSKSVYPNVFVTKPSDRQSRHTRDSQISNQSDNKGRTQGKLSSKIPRTSKYVNYPMLAMPLILDNELSVLLFPDMMSSKSSSGHPNVF